MKEYLVYEHQINEKDINWYRRNDYNTFDVDPVVIFKTKNHDECYDFFKNKDFNLTKYYNESIKKTVLEIKSYEIGEIDDEDEYITLDYIMPNEKEIEKYWEEN